MLNEISKHIKPITKKMAFTLAEILITIGLLGVVAAMTIPILVSNVEKNTALQRVKYAYNMMDQATELAEIDHGDMNKWTYGAASTGTDTLTWFNKYLASYVKYSNVQNTGPSILVTLDNGVEIQFYLATYMDINIYLNGFDRSKKIGRDIFRFRINQNISSDQFGPYDFGTTGTGREKWTKGDHGCNNTGGDKNYCAGLIMYDGWKIADDYPW